MTGEKTYLVRNDFTQCSTWREALGNAAPLLLWADVGYCIDAPEYVPAGGMRSSSFGTLPQVATRY